MIPEVRLYEQVRIGIIMRMFVRLRIIHIFILNIVVAADTTLERLICMNARYITPVLIIPPKAALGSTLDCFGFFVGVASFNKTKPQKEFYYEKNNISYCGDISVFAIYFGMRT